MIDLAAHADSYRLLAQFEETLTPFDKKLSRGCFDNFEDVLFAQAAREVAQSIDAYGPPEFRDRFIWHLLAAMGAEPESPDLAVLACAAATLTAPDYFGRRVVSIAVETEEVGE